MACLSRGALHADALDRSKAIKNMMNLEVLLNMVGIFDGVNNELVMSGKDSDCSMITTNKTPTFYY
jgi:hypothetical protein